MKRYTAMALVLILALASMLLGACTAKKEEETVNIANPFRNCETFEDAQKIAGFDVQMPETMPDGTERDLIQAVERTMIQAFYGETLLRKSTETGDITGDYNHYEKEETVTADGVDVTVRGNGDEVFAAYWTRDGYGFSVTCGGMSVQALEEIVAAMR